MFALAHGGHGVVDGHRPSKQVLLLGVLLFLVVVTFLAAVLPWRQLCRLRWSRARWSELRPRGAAVLLGAFLMCYVLYFSLNQLCFRHNHCMPKLRVCAVGRVIGCREEF